MKSLLDRGQADRRNKPGCNRGDIRSESRLDRPWQDSEYGLAE